MVKSGFLPRGYGWLLENTPAFLWGGRSIRMQTDAGEMVFPLKDPGCTGMLLFGRIHNDNNEGSLVEKLACSCRVMLDIGANVGWYSILMCRGMQGKGRVFAFEPNPNTFQYLRENTMNKSIIHSFEIAVGNSKEKASFFCSKSSNLSSSVRKVGEEVIVQSTSMDDFCRSWGVMETVDFIKCDVEGGELEVLRGARELRSARNSPVWLIEVDEPFLEQAGTSANEIMREIFQPENGANRLYYLDPSGRPVEIDHVSERRGTSNVFIVPDRRMEMFLEAIA